MIVIHDALEKIIFDLVFGIHEHEPDKPVSELQQVNTRGHFQMFVAPAWLIIISEAHATKIVQRELQLVHLESRIFNRRLLKYWLSSSYDQQYI